MTGSFYVDAVFSIEGRGTVLQGRTENGSVAAGMQVTLPGGSTRTIAAVEAIHGNRIPLGSIGLVLDNAGAGDVSELSILVQGKVLEIT